jgi:hypothetical protein
VRNRADRRDHGAALILAVGFMVFVGIVVSGISALISSGVGDRVQLQQLRDREYAADGAIEQEIVRLRSIVSQSSTDTCGTKYTLNGNDIRVDCKDDRQVVASGLGLIFQINVVFLACPWSTNNCSDGVNPVNGTVQPANVIIYADVNFPNTGDPNPATKIVAWRVSR